MSDAKHYHMLKNYENLTNTLTLKNREDKINHKLTEDMNQMR